MLKVLLVAYDNAEETADCLLHLQAQVERDETHGVLLLDNGSRPDAAAKLRMLASDLGQSCTYLRSEANTGFSGGMNRLIAIALADPEVECVLLLNNDTVPKGGLLRRMVSVLDSAQGVDMVAATLLQHEREERVDSLGITLYRSGLASNRKRPEQRLLGPTGGCMLLSRRLLEDLHACHGEWFDEKFFCYAEDTDLVMRARWLGYDAVHVDEAVALHHGSLSSGGPDNEFVLYHGIRNSIWALVKNAPALWLLAHLPWIILAHGGVVLSNLRKGRWRTVARLYWHAVRGLPTMIRKRRVVRRARRVPASAWWSWVEPRLYEPSYLREAWRGLFRRRGGAPASRDD